jgi:hypothetical protein
MKNKKTVLSALCLLLLTVSACENPTGGTDNTNLGKTGGTGTLSVTSRISGFMDKGGYTRTFSVSPKQAVTWTVEGTSEKSKTAIGQDGKLSIGANEASITLTVKATAVDNPAEWGTAEVKVRGWIDLSAGLEGKVFDVANYTAGIYALAYAEGLGTGKGRWVMSGAGINSKKGDTYPVTLYSDDNGETWVQDTRFLRGPQSQGESIGFLTGYYPEIAASFIYDGPAGDKKFVMGTARGNIFWSRDGITWTKVWSNYVMPPESSGGHSDPPGFSLSTLVYGEVDTGEVTEGRYLVSFPVTARNAWSKDAETWTEAERKYPYLRTDTKTFNQAMPARDYRPHLRYGTGMVNGVRKGVFLARVDMSGLPGTGVGVTGALVDLNLYTADGINWTTLADRDPDTIWWRNDPYDYWWWLGRNPVTNEPDASVTAMDREALAALDFRPAPLTGGNRSTIVLPLQIDTKGDLAFPAHFFVTGGDYVMAVGENARKLAIAHRGAYAESYPEL